MFFCGATDVPLSLSVRPHVRERSHVRPVINLTRYVSEWKIVFIKPIRTAVTQTSSRTVNGPSLVNATDIRAPNTPVSTRAPKARNSSTTWSTRGSATGPGAAACHVGRRPLRASPVQRELADHQQRRAHVRTRLLVLQNPQRPQLPRQLGSLGRPVRVGHPYQRQQTWLVNRPHNLPVDRHRGMADPLHDRAHDTAPLRSGSGTAECWR